MRFALAAQGVENAARYLRSITQVSNIVVAQGEQKISWSGYTPGITKGVYYPLEYQFLLDRQQYSLLLADGSFFQFFYGFDAEDALLSARLAFYPRPLRTSDTSAEILDAAEDALDRLDDGLYEHLYNWNELMELGGQHPANTSHIRFDFDRNATTHSASHVQFGAINELRLDADFFPQPLAFVQLCGSLLANFAPPLTAELGFERNNCLRLNRPDGLICLSSIPP